jgi:DNA replication and repair protein RecF
MIIKSLSVLNFRNYKSGEWRFSTGLNVLYGRNGQGKTNILEALCLASLAFSQRTAQEDDLINFAAEGFSVDVTARDNIGTLKNVLIKKKGRKLPKEIFLSGKKVRPRELIGELKTTVFFPEDLFMVKGEPAARRRFLDLQTAQLNGKYCFSLARYNKIVQQRNRLLGKIRKEGEDPALLDSWDEQLTREAADILEDRINMINKTLRLADSIYREIASGDGAAGGVYKRRENSGDSFLRETPADSRRWYEQEIAARRGKDIENMNTGVGPHRDDIYFTLNDLSMKQFASQGQQRSFVLALKMAEVQLIYNECGEYPVLLLDDVLSELDAERGKNLLAFLDGRVQTFITTTEKAAARDLPGAAFYLADGGNLYEE